MGLICSPAMVRSPLPALTMGAVGTIDARCRLLLALRGAVQRLEAGDIVRAKTLQDGVRKYVDLVWMFYAMPDVCKVVLSARLGIDCGRSIPPVNQLSDDEKRRSCEWRKRSA